MKTFSVLAAILALLFVLGREYGRKVGTPAVVPPQTVASAPAQITPVLERACHDCHSDRTIWPWYSYLPPVSFMIRRDVEKGRSKLDFSQWENEPRRPTRNELEEICDAVASGSMPPMGYRMLHRDARLSADEIDLLCRSGNSADADSTQMQER